MRAAHACGGSPKLSAPLPLSVRFVGLASGRDRRHRAHRGRGPGGRDRGSRSASMPRPTMRAPRNRPSCARRSRRVALAESEVERLGRALERLGAQSIVERIRPKIPPPRGARSSPRGASSSTLRADARARAARAARGSTSRARGRAARARGGRANATDAAGTARAARSSTSCASTSSSSSRRDRRRATVTIHVEYQVAAARWAPSYVARLEGASARSSCARSSRRTPARTGPTSRCGCRPRSPSGSRAPRAARAADRPPPARAGEARISRAARRRGRAVRRLRSQLRASRSEDTRTTEAPTDDAAERIRRRDGRDVRRPCAVEIGRRDAWRVRRARRRELGRGVVTREGQVRPGASPSCGEWPVEGLEGRSANRSAPSPWTGC